MLAAKPVKILAAYVSPTRPLIVSDLSACLGGGLPVLMDGKRLGSSLAISN
jgi:hypothetical protein